MSIANVISSTARTPFACSHTSVDGASITMPGHDLGRAQPPVDPSDRAEQPGRHRELVPAVVEHHHPAAVERLFELPPQLRSGSSQPPRPVATIFMCTDTGVPISPAAMTSRIFTSGG